jgi:hypothetical protein
MFTFFAGRVLFQGQSLYQLGRYALLPYAVRCVERIAVYRVRCIPAGPIFSLDASFADSTPSPPREPCELRSRIAEQVASPVGTSSILTAQLFCGISFCLWVSAPLHAKDLRNVCRNNILDYYCKLPYQHNA